MRNSKKGDLPTTPWLRRTNNGVYFGRNNSVWMYYEFPLTPLQWEDAPRRLQVGSRLENLLAEIGQSSRDIGGGIKLLARPREVHVFGVQYDASVDPPQGTPERLREFMEEVLVPVAPAKSLLVGVKLRSAALAQLTRAAKGSIVGQAKAALSGPSEGEGAFDSYKEDFDLLDGILRRNGAAPPSALSLSQLESWFNYGRGADVPIAAADTSIHVTGGGSYELAAVMEFTQPVMNAPAAQWLLDAMTHPEGAVVVSIRGELTPPKVVENMLRSSQRKLRAQEEEEAKTGDIGRDDNQAKFSFAREAENLVRDARQAWLTEASVLFARPANDADDTYLDMLRTEYGIEAKPLEKRQIKALDEMQPCSTARVNPFPQVINPAMVSYGGLPAFSTLGDDRGVWMGMVDPDYRPLFLHPFGAPENDQPPIMGIFGDPGSGKAQPLDAKVLTPTGWKLMGDLRVGDAVTGSDGKAHRVLGVYPQGVQPIYRVTFNDGSSAEATGDHLWSVATCASLAEGCQWQTRTTDELRASLLNGDSEHPWLIPVTAPVEHPVADLPVDPYLLGVLLGDDDLTRGVSLSTGHPDLVDSVRQGMPRRQHPHSSSELLRSVGVDGLHPNEKHLPGRYLFADMAQRLEILRGLMDSAGAVSPDSTLTFCSSSQRLAADVAALVQSLGGTARTTCKEAPMCVRTAQELSVQSFHLTITLPEEVIPFRLNRTKPAPSPRAMHRAPSRSIVDITYTRTAPAQCIAVSAADRLYITDNYVLTHNTFAAQLLAGQAALAGVNVIFVNPKPRDSLVSFGEWVGEYGTPQRVVSLSKLEAEGGAFDPFRFCEPQMAAEILTRHILTVIGTSYSGGLDGRQEIMLGDGLARGAAAGARCAVDALAYVDDESIRETVLAQARASTLFSLAIGHTPRDQWDDTDGLTLIEFDREIPLPPAGKAASDFERDERIALAAMRLVTRAALEILMSAGGGVLVVDEAHHYLSSSEGMASLQRIGREGRSMNLLPIFLTQRVTDLLHADMQSYMSRVLAMKLNDPKEAAAALQLCQLEATPDRIAFLRDAGPQRAREGVPGRGALGFFRDLYDRHSVIMVGPIPENVRLAFSTNPEDRRTRAAQRAEANALAEPTLAPTVPGSGQ